MFDWIQCILEVDDSLPPLTTLDAVTARLEFGGDPLFEFSLQAADPAASEQWSTVVQTALEHLKAPDPDSQTKLYEGRRLEEMEGGWLLLNYVSHRDYQSKEQLEWAEKKRKYREKKASDELGHVPDVRGTSGDKSTDTEANADTEADTETTKQPIVGMELIPTRDRPIVAKSVLKSLQRIGQMDIAKEHLLGWQITAVFAYWVAKFNKDNARTKLTLGRWQRLKKYIGLYDIETCLYAVDGAKIHPHANQEDGKTFHEFAEIFMNKPEGSDRLEKYSEYARKKDKHPKHRLLKEHPELEGKP